MEAPLNRRQVYEDLRNGFLKSLNNNQNIKNINIIDKNDRPYFINMLMIRALNLIILNQNLDDLQLDSNFNVIGTYTFQLKFSGSDFVSDKRVQINNHNIVYSRQEKYISLICNNWNGTLYDFMKLLILESEKYIHVLFWSL